MRISIRQLVIILQFIYALSLCGQEVFLSAKDIRTIKQKLSAFAEGQITLEQVTEVGGEEWGRKLITYYLARSNDVTIKMTLPISRCYAAFGKYTEAANLANEYVKIYSNDWHGWNILGAAKLALQSYDEGLVALTNAVSLGSTKNFEALGYAALVTGRIEVFEKFALQPLLALKDAEKTSKAAKLKIVTILVGYSIKADKREIFISALAGVNASDIESEETLKEYLKTGCEVFKAKETEQLCSQLAKVNRENGSAGEKK